MCDCICDRMFTYTRIIPKVSGFNVLGNNIFHYLYISETYILYWLIWVCCGYNIIVIYDIIEQLIDTIFSDNERGLSHSSSWIADTSVIKFQISK